MIVMKFGGSSLAGAERIRQVGSIAKNNLSSKPILVLSAVGDTTNLLLEAGTQALSKNPSLGPIETLYRNLVKELHLDPSPIEALLEDLQFLLIKVSTLGTLSPQDRDQLVSYGERMTVRIFTDYLNRALVPSKCYDAWEIGMKTDSNFGHAKVLPETYQAIDGFFEALKHEYTHIPVVTGFIAHNERGEITTFGRGGSDLTATVIGCAIQAEEVQFWKDVSGVLTANPEYIKNAKPVGKMSFEEAAEIASLGVQIFHPGSMLPVIQKSIPVRVKNSYDPDSIGTLINEHESSEYPSIKVINLKNGMKLVEIESNLCSGDVSGDGSADSSANSIANREALLARVLEWFQKQNIRINLIANQGPRLAFTLDQIESLEPLRNHLGELANVRVCEHKTILSIIGKLAYPSDVFANASQVFLDHEIQTEQISFGNANVNLSFILDELHSKKAYQLLHDRFFT